jgi:ATP-dependent RNA helicase SUPV3L1/SUV3
MAGYRAAGERAIRIDMLERLADMLRDKDSRGGFEANPDMLSITGMTLEQFADLMQGLGYKAEKGERVKTRVEAAKPAEAEGDAATTEDAATDAPAEAPVEDEKEVFYTFTWGGRANNQRRERPQGQRPRGKGPKGGKPKGKGPSQDKGSKSYEAKPQKAKQVDPDNPFAAALAGFKTK